MWLRNRKLVVIVTIILIMVLVGILVYIQMEKKRTEEAAQQIRETVLNDLVQIEYNVDRPVEERKAIQDALLHTGTNDGTIEITESDRAEILDTLVNAPKTVPNE